MIFEFLKLEESQLFEFAILVLCNVSSSIAAVGELIDVCLAEVDGIVQPWFTCQVSFECPIDGGTVSSEKSIDRLRDSNDISINLTLTLCFKVGNFSRNPIITCSFRCVMINWTN